MSDAPDRLVAALADRYRIERELGAGGMATVYLAEDLKHDRKVAIKVLKPELAAVLGAERFVVEIKTTAALSHPHILPLFDSGEAGGFLYYVMPYIEGETIRDRLNRETQFSVDEAVRITREIADALDYAHRSGVIHRDIKPENILLHDGRAMVMDFGIALAVSAAAGGRMTETGLSLGTPHYMSPEQATADKAITGRSDIYSLASVCYEMLSAEPPHTGGTAQAIIMKIIAERARPVGELRKSVPPHITAALEQALEKVPADRFESAKAFAEALGSAGFTYGTVAASFATAGGGKRGGNRTTLAAVAVATIAVVAALSGWLRPPPAQAPQVPTRTQLTGLDFLETGQGGWRLAISRDGRWIVAGNAPDLYIRAADELSWRLLPNTTGAINPSFSPDGQFVLFNAAGQILKVPITGGTALPIAEGSSAHWGTDETIVFTRGNGLYKVSAAGGEPTLLFDPAAGEGSVTGVFRPHLLPNGRAVLFATGDASNSRIALLDLETEEVRILVASGNQPTYVPTGHIIYGLDEQSLMGVPFDLTSLEVTGTPVTLLPELTVYLGGASQYAVSASGAIVYDRATDNGTTGALRLADVTLGGEVTPLPLAAGIFMLPRVSPDGRKIAYEDASALRVYDRLSGANPAIGEDAILRRAPAWTSAGDRLAFREGPRTSAVTMFWPTDGRGPTTRLGEVGGALLDFAPGDTLSVAYGPRWGLNPDLYVVRIGEGGASYEPLLNADWNEAGGDLSPDGRWLAYHSNESGENRVYVHSFPALTVRHEISPGPGTEPAWSPDGRRIYYRSGTGFYAVDVTTTPTFVARPPRLLFDNPRLATFYGPGYTRNWDVRPDGTGFVMVLDEAQKEAGGTTLLDRRLTDVVLVVNWFEELRARMGSEGARR